MYIFLRFSFLFLCCFLTACSFYFENDVFAPRNKDMNYTSGLSGRVLLDPSTEIGVTQVFFTPDDLRDPNPQPGTRPYAGILTVHYARKLRLPFYTSTAGVRIGCTGPCSLAETIQKLIHEPPIDKGTDPKGWHLQIPTEPVAALFLEDTTTLLARQYTTNLLHTRFELGNDITRATVGTSVKVGLRPPTNEETPILQPSDTKNATQVYLSAGALGKWTLYNVTIDNYLFNNGTDLELLPLGYDLYSGLTFSKNQYAVTLTYIWRYKEFKGDRNHQFGSVRISYKY